MITYPNWQKNLALSLFRREATYNAGVAVSSANGCLMTAYDNEPFAWDDTLVNDKDTVTSLEHGYDQEIVKYGAKMTYKETRAKPNTVAGLAALTLGSITSTQDSAYTAYRHKITPVTVGSALHSIQANESLGGTHYKYTGVKGNTLKISGSDQAVSVECELIGSGSRATATDTMPAKITESWLNMSNALIWMEDGTNISLAATPAQGAENISSATPDALSAYLKSFEFSWDNKLARQDGCGNAGIAYDAHYGRRSCSAKMSLLWDSSRLAYYLNQSVLAIEFNLRGGLIAAGGSMYYGIIIRVPRCKMKTAPTPKGGVNDDITHDIDLEIYDDGTNPVVEIYAYNAQAAYLVNT